MNILIIMSDEHSQQVMGCAGHSVVKTPVMDRLASEGTMFTNCYTSSPLCTPARASFITGQYVNQLGTWDNATPYDGKVMGIPQYLHENGEVFTSFGKLDLHPEGTYKGLQAKIRRDRTNAQVEGCFRSQDLNIGLENRYKLMGIREGATRDNEVVELALHWLEQKKEDPQPWVLYLGLNDPHFPFFTSQEKWEQYDKLMTEVPKVAKGPFTELNEPLRSLRNHFKGDTVNEETIRNAHVGYYALTSRLDDNLGIILDALKQSGMEDDTLIIYTSDHGEQLGHHGLWWKCCMYEESANIPLILKGPGIQAGAKVEHPVSLIDIFPTICEARNLPLPESLPGRSLLNLAFGKEDVDRNDFAFSEYHAHGMPVGMYMIRWKQWKYVYYVGYEPQLFDLENDKEELLDLASHADESDNIRQVLIDCEKRLRMICDPEEVDNRAQGFQQKLRIELGLKADFSHGKVKKVPRPEYTET